MIDISLEQLRHEARDLVFERYETRAIAAA